MNSLFHPIRFFKAVFQDRNSPQNYGGKVNKFVGLSGILLILIGILLRSCVVWSTIFLSVGTSIFATAIVTWINAAYLIKSQRIETLVSVWRLYDLYETKADMNTKDANKALEQCEESIDIIGEGLSNYIAAKGEVLRNKILNKGVIVRIISCDSSDMLKSRARDETRSGQSSGKDAIQKVIDLIQWIDDLRVELTDKRDNIKIRFHNSYPSLSYLRIDKMLFISTNLCRKQSQQSFALSFEIGGKGGKYFQEYFDDLWKNFTHEECKLKEG